MKRLAVRRFLRGLRQRRALIPTALVARLVVGTVLLLSVMQFSADGYRYGSSFGPPLAALAAEPEAAPASDAAAASDASDALPAEAPAPDERRTLPVRMVRFETGTPDTTQLGDGDWRLMQTRAAVNILLRSGYLSDASVTPPSGPEGFPEYALTLDQNVMSCALSVLHGEDAQRFAMTGIAIVAVEKFNRTALQRAFERRWADTMLAMTGKMPNLSMGPAQIRPSTLRRYADASALRELHLASRSGREIDVMLMDECQSLGLATALLSALTDEAKRSTSCATDAELPCEKRAIMAYAGQHRARGGAFSYESIVTEAANLLQVQP